MWNPNIKEMNITTLVQVIFNTWFEYVGYLPCGIMFLIWLLSTSTGPTDRGTLSREKSPAQNYTNHSWHIWSITAPSLYTAFFCIWVFTFLEITNIICLNCWLFFLPSSVLKWLHKNSPILFFLTQLIWQLLQYNLTTLLN